ncbi:MAG TPA: hypothetical protein VKF14_22110 [Candidatus Dormibacteraeota bacterium]|nr:hypothetical protein [Candidatus Dormibacteraeota bacterium]
MWRTERLMAGVAEHYSAHDIEARLLAAIRTAGLDPYKSLARR